MKWKNSKQLTSLSIGLSTLYKRLQYGRQLTHLAQAAQKHNSGKSLVESTRVMVCGMCLIQYPVFPQMPEGSHDCQICNRPLTTMPIVNAMSYLMEAINGK